ncbi:PREDICTED: uncharacterized protein LOC109396676 [Hipposideros armiger]|uniref:Uncharacterized protein LOC109396676 n=1 Tax=Hipposideros armiger TaxID=186990 RepID=A0A8B7TKW2_HIPAR|nr:PREDICTED: uncharacterized protein LOC109396676 [Hipposideros armiger]
MEATSVRKSYRVCTSNLRTDSQSTRNWKRDSQIDEIAPCPRLAGVAPLDHQGEPGPALSLGATALGARIWSQGKKPRSIEKQFTFVQHEGFIRLLQSEVRLKQRNITQLHSPWLYSEHEINMTKEKKTPRRIKSKVGPPVCLSTSSQEEKAKEREELELIRDFLCDEAFIKMPELWSPEISRLKNTYRRMAALPSSLGTADPMLKVLWTSPYVLLFI